MYRPSPYTSDMMYGEFMFQANYKKIVNPYREVAILKDTDKVALLDDVVIFYNKPNDICQIKARVAKSFKTSIGKNLTIELQDKKENVIVKYEVKKILNDTNYTPNIDGIWYYFDCKVISLVSK